MRRSLFVFGIVLLLIGQAATARADGPVHTVAYGETLYSIARKYGVSPQSLASANGITINSWVYAGQRLSIPGAAFSGNAASSQPVTAQLSPTGGYVVRAGDTLYGLAARFGTSLDALANANDIPPNGVLYVGWQLKIPTHQTQAVASIPPAKPQNATSQDAGRVATTYIVQPGDTLYRIALNYGVSIQAVIIANNLPTQFVYSGQRLTIPGRTSVASPPANSAVAKPANGSSNAIPVSNASASSNNASAVAVTGIPIYRQRQTLTCEESAAAMALRGEFSEAQIVAAMPRSENPFEGIRGETNHPLLGGLTHYGTYAQGLQKGLAALGVKSTVLYGLPYARFKQAILDNLKAGSAVLWWTTWRESYQTPQWLKLATGITIHLVPYEHTVVIVSAGEDGIRYHDPYDGTVRFTTWSNHQRTSGYFGNMALIID